ncbi:hypothetical protein IFM89_029538, partial [Coptis chinensis]
VVTIDDYESIDDEKALQAVVAKQPVALSIYIKRGALTFYKSGIFTRPCGLDSIHSMTIVGYGVDNGIKYWIVKNSWGADWGEDGYIRMERNVADTKYGLCGIAKAAIYPIKKSLNRIYTSSTTRLDKIHMFLIILGIPQYYFLETQWQDTKHRSYTLQSANSCEPILYLSPIVDSSSSKNIHSFIRRRLAVEGIIDSVVSGTTPSYSLESKLGDCKRVRWGSSTEIRDWEISYWIAIRWVRLRIHFGAIFVKCLLVMFKFGRDSLGLCCSMENSICPNGYQKKVCFGGQRPTRGVQSDSCVWWSNERVVERCND